MIRKIIVICLLITLSGLMTGCGDKKTEIKTDEGTVTVTESGDNTVKVESEDGDTTYEAGSNASKPDTWPDKDFPIMPDGQILGSMANAGDDGGLMVVFGTNKSVDEAQGFYKDVVAGASDAAEMSIEGTKTMAGTKAGFTYGITISTEDTGYGTDTEYPTYVTVILSPENN